MPITLKVHRDAEPYDEVMALLVGCHERIRRFSALAVTLAEVEAPAADRAEAAAAVVRYFTIALPLHARDEDESLAPRLRGRDGALDDALDRVAAEHAAHEPLLAAVVAACRAIAADPARHAALAATLRTDAAALEAAFAEHLALEESRVFPAIAALSAADRAALRAELTARRA